MEKSLSQFQSMAERLADLAAYDVIDVGVVWLNPSRVVMALRATLTRREWAGATSRFDGPQVSAARVVLERDKLGRLIQVMGSGLPVGDELGLDAAVHLRPLGEKPSWHVDMSQHFTSGRAAALRMSSTDLQRELGTSTQGHRALDAEIAQASQYRFSRLSRLVKHYTGIDWRDNPYSEVALGVPWPVEHLFAKWSGGSVQVDVEGLPGLSTDAFILNVEGAREDLRD